MTGPVQDLKRGECRFPTNPELLRDPLGFIQEDHLRERQICAWLDILADAERPDVDAGFCILEFLRVELPLHLEDEEQDLFPLLRRRCDAEDDIGRAIARLATDHCHAGEDTPLVIHDLERLVSAGGEFTGGMRARFRSYASHARRHLILENAIILPFARLRLTASDLETLRLRMMQRRGIERLEDVRDAD